jgi:ABC-type nitrate/sulfonate/bicarbonate transport system permease component
LRGRWEELILPLSLAAGLAAWEVLTRLYDLPAFILPRPGSMDTEYLPEFAVLTARVRQAIG